MYNKILIPLDGSDLAEQALAHGLAIAAHFNSQVYLVQVVMTPIAIAAPYDISYEYNEKYRESALNAANQYLGSIASGVDQKLEKQIHTRVIEGSVVDSLLDYIEFNGIDLVVMATHGRSGVSRWVFGSVAERILKAASCPVFLIRVQ